jgi:hypothetical protein
MAPRLLMAWDACRGIVSIGVTVVGYHFSSLLLALWRGPAPGGPTRDGPLRSLCRVGHAKERAPAEGGVGPAGRSPPSASTMYSWVRFGLTSHATRWYGESIHLMDRSTRGKSWSPHWRLPRGSPSARVARDRSRKTVVGANPIFPALNTRAVRSLGNCEKCRSPDPVLAHGWGMRQLSRRPQSSPPGCSWAVRRWTRARLACTTAYPARSSLRRFRYSAK